MTTSTLEERVAVLEKTVAELLGRLAKPAPRKDCGEARSACSQMIPS
jgi:hypothetical protein